MNIFIIIATRNTNSDNIICDFYLTKMSKITNIHSLYLVIIVCDNLITSDTSAINSPSSRRRNDR